MTISLLERFGPFILSSDEGHALAETIAVAVERGEIVDLDFAGVRSVVSAFLNPALGELYARFPSERVESLVVWSNETDVQRATLEAVRDQARRYYNDPDYKRRHDVAVAELFS